jgi:hypothetical protein
MSTSSMVTAVHMTVSVSMARGTDEATLPGVTTVHMRVSVSMTRGTDEAPLSGPTEAGECGVRVVACVMAGRAREPAQH